MTEINIAFDCGGVSPASSVETETLQNQVYDTLARGLMSGAFRPGEVLSYQRIAQKFGVSAMPVRDAFRRLAAEGAVLIAPKRGLRIPEATAGRVEELARVRVTLEGLGTELAASRIQEQSMQRLDWLAVEMIEDAKNGAWARYLQKNQEFHFIIYRAAGSELLERMIRTLWIQTGPIMTYFGPRTSRESLDLHNEIIGAMRRRAASEARRLMEADINDGMEYTLTEIREKMRPAIVG